MWQLERADDETIAPQAFARLNQQAGSFSRIHAHIVSDYIELAVLFHGIFEIHFGITTKMLQALRVR